MIEQKSDMPMEAVADESTVRRPTDRIEARNAGAIVAIGCGAPSDEVPAHCLRACLQGDPALLSSHGCNWLRRAAEGIVDVSDVNDGRCCQGFDVAAQRVDVGGQPVVLLSVEATHDRVGTDACEAAVRATANAAGKLVSRVGQVLDENTGLIGEVLRSYEQLNFIFDITREVSRISDAAELEQVLLCRLGDLLALDCIYVLGANGSRRRYDLPSDCVTEAATGLPLEHDLSDEINRVRRTGKVCATTAELRDVVLGPLKRLDERTDVVLAARIEGNGPFTAGDLMLFASMLSYGADLLRNIELQTRLKQTAIESIRALVNAIDKKDAYTCGHSERVAFWARLTGRQMGLSAVDLELLEWAGNLHDVGKIGIPESIVNKPGRLTEEEFAEIKKHPVMGYEILKPVASFKPILEATLYHHENPDGTGYPEGLKGEEIPLPARIMRAADVFDALYSERSYRRAFSIEKVLEIIRHDAGTKIDTEAAHALETAVQTFRRRCPDRFTEMYQHVRRPEDGV